jgi:branched-subunit amino acid aminotransferase/4-amino-4-deoxychorismate lyase
MLLLGGADGLAARPQMTATVKAPAGQSSTRLVFTPTRELTLCAPPTPAPLVADSWLMVNGGVRALHMHEERFCHSCLRLLPKLDSTILASFLDQVRRALPRDGRWFPRMEAHSGEDPKLALWLREAPKPGQQTRLWVSNEPDPRRAPQVKGPDLAALAALREKAFLAGADDALLTDADGTVLEAAHSTVVWWRGESLCLPDTKEVLPSVTCGLIVEIAQRRGVTVIREQVSTAELRGLETWTLNALHGIRPVSAWYEDGEPQLAQLAPVRAREWSAALAEMVLPIDESPRW